MKGYMILAGSVLAAAAAVTVFTIASQNTAPVIDDPNAPRVLVNRDRNGLALQGYDPVGYFTDGKPVKGDPQYTTRRNGAVYRFASAEHKAMFDADPARYEPQYGGYCGFVSRSSRISDDHPKYDEHLAITS
jgi:YHS domain-containing protein